MGEDAVDELARHFGSGLRAVVERGYGREDGGSCIRGEGHVAEMNPIERSFAHAEEKRATFFEAYVGGAMDEI